MEEYLLEADRVMRKRSGLALLSSEAIIILHVSENGGSTIKEAHSYSALSGRAFYTKIRKLVSDGYIELATSTDDKRKRCVVLTDRGRALVGLVMRHLDVAEKPLGDLARGELGLRHSPSGGGA